MLIKYLLAPRTKRGAARPPRGEGADLENRILRRSFGRSGGPRGAPDPRMTSGSSQANITYFSFSYLTDPDHTGPSRRGPSGPPWTESLILAQDERWRRA